MDQTSTQSLVDALEDGRRQVLSAVGDLTDGVASARPAADRWSVLECLEHLVAVEHGFLGFAQQGGLYEQARIDPAREQSLAAGMLDRSGKRQAPESMRPVGRFQSVADAVTAFNEARDTSVRFARDRGEGLYLIKATHPRFGEMNGIEVLYLMNGHALRHVAQIRETREAVA
jgi:uncharacterized damage-inducible protein DinB